MTDKEVLENLRGKHLPVIEWYFYQETEQEEIQEIKEIFQISEKYKIVGRCTLLGDIVVSYKNKIGVISHDEPEEKPLTMVKRIAEFGDFLKLLGEYSGYDDEDDINQLKAARKQLKKLKKQAPKGLKDKFEDEIYEVEELIDFID